MPTLAQTKHILETSIVQRTFYLLEKMSILVKISVLILGCSCLANLADSKANPSQVVSYMEKYGYVRAVNPVKGEIRSHDELVEAVKKLQRMGGIPETGKLDDPELLKLLEKPRCGMSDFGPSDNAKRKRRYTLQGSYWKKRDLTYKILNYSPDLTRQQIDQTIKDAFNEWSKVSTLTFTRVSGNTKADINIKFVRGAHDDGYPFDGPGGTLAHAFYPQDNSQEIYGDAHFDDDELFTLKTHSGIDLFWVAVHEFGHSLGLDHSYEFNALMYPYYRGYTPNFKLHWDDVNGIQKLYGVPRPPGQTTTPVPEPATPTPHTKTEKPGIPDKCSSSLDAFVMSASGYSYAFKGQYFWPIGENFGAWTSALKIKDYWSGGLEGDIDASFYNHSNKVTYIIKGDKFWMFNDRVALTPQPLPITDPKLNLKDDRLVSPDAALQWDRNGKIYFFKGNLYWRYDPQRRLIDVGYPRKISDGWRGVIPDNLDAAIQWKNKRSYFFKGLTYTAIDDLTLKVPEVPKGDAPYPRNIGKYWMACSQGKYVGGKILPDTNSVITLLPNLFILVSSLVLTSYF